MLSHADRICMQTFARTLQKVSKAISKKDYTGVTVIIVPNLMTSSANEGHENRLDVAGGYI